MKYFHSNVCTVVRLHNARSSSVATQWFVENCEASSLLFGRRHLVVLEPEVTIFGRESGAEQTLSYQLMLVLAW